MKAIRFFKFVKVFVVLGLILLIFIAIAGYLVGCASLPTDFTRLPSHAITGTENTELGKFFAEKKASHASLSGFYLLGNGLDAFVARAALAYFAERSIDVQYYLYHGDLIGYLLTDQLVKAADRGVRVRMLLDDMDLAGRDLGIGVLDSHPNIHVRIFNPFSRNVGRGSQFVTRWGSVTRRMHNKSFTADNQVTVLGGRNIGNEYFDADSDMAFADLDVMAVGPVVDEVSSVFDRYWNSELAYPVSVLIKKEITPAQINAKRRQFNDYISRQENSIYLQALRESDLAQKIRSEDIVLSWGDADLVFDQPEKLLHSFEDEHYHLAPQLRPYIADLKDELIVISPYFVPGKPGTALLTALAKKGVRVRILTNSLASNDVAVVHAGYAKYRKALLRGGVELYEMNKALSRDQRKKKKGGSGSAKASLHAKSFIFDRQQIFIGSLNLDPRAILHNTEIGVVFFSPELAGQFAEWFVQNVQQLAFRVELKSVDGNETLLWHGVVNGKAVIFTQEPYAGFWRRLGVGILRLLPIESQL